MDGDFRESLSRRFWQIQDVMTHSHLRQLFRQNHFFIWLPPLVYYGLVSFFSSLSADEILVSYPFPGFDKLIHFLEYGIFAVFVMRAVSWEKYLHHASRLYWGCAVLLIGVAAGLDEYHQAFVGGRDLSFYDWLADMGGGVLFLIAGRLLYKRHMRKILEMDSDHKA